MPETQIILREPDSNDLERLLALEKTCFPTDRLSRRSFRYWIDSDERIFLVAESDGVIIGYILISFYRGTRLGRIYSLATDPRWRGRGIARQLIEAVQTLTDCLQFAENGAEQLLAGRGG